MRSNQIQFEIEGLMHNEMPDIMRSNKIQLFTFFNQDQCDPNNDF